MKETHGFPKEKLHEIVRPLLSTVKDHLVLLQSQYQEHWWSGFLPRLRVFSVAEEKDNLLMWSHYARDHTGIVFEFRVLPEHDNPLCVAGPVQYCKVPPPFFTENQWVDDILGLRELDWTALYFQYAYVKSDIWEYEKEWRVWDLLSRPEDALYSDYPLRPNEIAAVYVGCKAASDTTTEILRLIAKKHPGTKIFQTHKSPDKYEVGFQEL